MKYFNTCFTIAGILLCACNSKVEEPTDPEEGKVEIVEVLTDSQADDYDSIQGKWICNHEGTLEELCKTHWIDSTDTHEWIFKKLKK